MQREHNSEMAEQREKVRTLEENRKKLYYALGVISGLTLIFCLCSIKLKRDKSSIKR